MKRLFVMLMTVILLTGFAWGCSSDDEATPEKTADQIETTTYKDVTPPEAKELIETTPDLVILDVSPLYDQGHIPGAVNHPMFDGSLEKAIPSLDMGVPYLVYCHSDSVSIAAANALVDAGFKEVYRLKGNYAAWVDAGYETETPASPEPKAEAEWSADGLISDGEYSGHNTYGDYDIHWATDADHIYVAMQAKTEGWVSMAVQPGSRMKDADMVFGFVKDEEPVVLDLFSTGDFGPHPPDTELGGTNDILESSGMEQDGVTTIEFKRKLSTGDDYDHEIDRSTTRIIWAYGLADELTASHSSRGYGEISH